MDRSRCLILSLITSSLILTGCLSQPGNEASSSTDIDNDLSVRPSVLCGEGRAVVGAEPNGDVVCGSAKLNGQPAKKEEADHDGECESDQVLRWTSVPGSRGQLQIPLCDDEIEESKDDVTLGAAPTFEFHCPFGSALKGFSSFGEPICAALVASELADFAYLMDEDECPWGLKQGRLEHSEFTLPSCLVDPSLPRQIKLVDQRVARYDRQLNKVCPSDKVVIGFDANRQIICGNNPQHLKRPPRRYWVTKYDGHVESPVCRPGYRAQAAYLEWSDSSARAVKIWTCQQGH